MKPMHVKLHFRIGMALGGIIFFAVVMSYLFVGHRLTEILTAETRHELQRDLMLNKLTLEQKSQDWQSGENLRVWMAQVGRALDVRVTLIDLDGRVLDDTSISQEKLITIENHRARPEVTAALESGYGENTRFSQSVKEYMFYMAVPVGLPKPWAILRFCKPLYDIEIYELEFRNKVIGQLFFILFFSLAAGVLTAFVFTRPLRALVKIAQKRVQGDFSGALHSQRRDEFGLLAQACTVMTDKITTMRRSEEWYTAVFSGIREAIIVTEASGDIILVNPAAAKMLHIDGAMFKSRSVRNLSDSKLQELFARVHSTQIALRKEEMSLVTSKGLRIMQISSMPLIKENRFEGTVFVLNDITTLRNLEKIRRDFVSSVSHELRTPLTVITGYTETLLEGAIDDPKHATPFLNIILQASRQLTALVNDVLDLSKIESGYIEYQFTGVDINEVVKKSVDLLKPSLEKKKIRLDINIPGELPPVYADARYLDIVIRNLLDNAIKYVDDSNGRIRISAFRVDDDVRLEVEDNGIGISKNDLERIFERFYRVDKGRSRQLGGTGLGLSIVKHIVLAHKGDVEVRSRVNHGSVFSVRLRVAHEETE
jgi:two-component system, OmpR family, phosphate regulon sensor histidine kinase PhoR